MTEPTSDCPSDLPPAEEHSRGGILPIIKLLAYFFALGFGLLLTAAVVAMFVPPAGPTDLKFFAAFAVPYAAVTVLVTLAFVIFVDKRPVETLGLNRRGSWIAELWFGAPLGAALIALVFIVSYAAGWTKITGSLFFDTPDRAVPVLVAAFVVMVSVAVAEEVIIRGYVLQTLRWGYGTPVALIGSSVLFGVMHLFNPGAGLHAVGGTLAAGLILAYAYLLTGRLWLPIGIHFGWNLALGPVFGFPVSGIEIPAWIDQTTEGPVLWTGGEFGPEAGLLGIIAVILGALAIRWFGRTR